MVAYAQQRNIGAYLDVAASLAPVAGTGSDQNGASVDRLGPAGAGALSLSAVALVPFTTSGGVTGGTIVVTLQDSADDSSFAAYTAPDGTAATTTHTITGTNSTGLIRLNVNLAGARRYIRVVVDSNPTGGTPASIVGALLVLGGDDQLPAA